MSETINDRAVGILAIAETYLESPGAAIADSAYRACIERLAASLKEHQQVLREWENSFAGHTYVPDEEYLLLIKMTEDKLGMPVRVLLDRHMLAKRGVDFGVEDRARTLYEADPTNTVPWDKMPREQRIPYLEAVKDG